MREETSDTPLDCVFCGKNYWDFNSLAYHTTHDCPNAPAAIKLARTKESKPMARSPRSTKDGGLPNPGNDQPSGDFSPFLKHTDIGHKVGARGSIVFLGKPGRKIESDFGQQIAFAVKMKGKSYDFAIRVGSGNHTRLYDRFGSKPPKGKIAVEVKEFNNNRYVAISGR